jgi:hypothetical protein
MSAPREKKALLGHLLRDGVTAAVLVLLAPFGWAVVGTVEVSVSDDGQPVPGATVSLSVGGEVVAEEETDESGAVVLEAESGTYRIGVSRGERNVGGIIAVEPGAASRLAADLKAASLRAISAGGSTAARLVDVTAPDGRVSVEGQLVRTRLEAGSATVFVNLPHHAVDGAPLSGSVYVETAEDGAEELDGRVVSVLGHAVPLENGKLFTLPRLTPGAVPISLGEPGPVPPEPDRGTAAPAEPLACPARSVLQAGWFGRVPGGFDGVAGSTSIELGGEPAKLIAESPAGVVFLSPREPVGLVDLSLRDGARSATCRVRSVRLDLAADRLELERGDKTTVHVTLSGLSGIEEPVTFLLENESPRVVRMSGGNSQTVTIAPNQVGDEGTHRTDRVVTGRTDGRFHLSARLLP